MCLQKVKNFLVFLLTFHWSPQAIADVTTIKVKWCFELKRAGYYSCLGNA